MQRVGNLNTEQPERGSVAGLFCVLNGAEGGGACKTERGYFWPAWQALLD